ncbi:hypothetical protein [Methylobacterium oryzisoli]|uniref:hypothetical protein n=1 Tax=Methylobacterium oryzisoli TaxID=3385502 RepID=UPI003891C867
MESVDLNEPAELTVWSDGPNGPKAVVPVEFATLRAALSAAAHALHDARCSPWIMTASGMILTPDWVQSYIAMAGLG